MNQKFSFPATAYVCYRISSKRPLYVSLTRYEEPGLQHIGGMMHSLKIVRVKISIRKVLATSDYMAGNPDVDVMD